MCVVVAAAVSVRPMDSDPPSPSHAARAARDRGPARSLSPSDTASAAAASHRDQMLAAMRAVRPKRRWEDLQPSEQVVSLLPDELWDTIVSQWCRPGAELITGFADEWSGDDLAAIVYHLGLTVQPRKGRRDYWDRAMRKQVIEAVHQYAADHPELFDAEAAAAGEPQDEGDEGKESDVQDPPRRQVAVEITPEKVASDRDQSQLLPASPPRGRRSPRGSAASRSADAMRALAQLPLVGKALERAEADSPERDPKAAKAMCSRAGIASPPSKARSARVDPPKRPPVDLLRFGHHSGPDGDDSPHSSSSSDSDDADRDWAQDSDDAAAAASARRGGRLLRDEFESRLATTGVQRRSFAKGFLRNALGVAAGRTLYQLYKDTTSQWDASVHCKREALAHARTLDYLLQAPRESHAVRDALEHVCRRLGGVHTAAVSGSWEMCDRLEAEASTHSFVPDYFMAAALKQVTREQAIRKSVAEGLKSGKPSHLPGSGRKPRGRGSSGGGSGSGGSNGAATSQPGAGSSSSHKSGGSKAGSRKK